MAQYFQLFGLPETFSLNENELEQTHRQLIAQFHPDKFAAASAFEQKQAVMMSAMVNQAYAVLRHPIDRAAYLLQQQNINPDDPNNTQVAPEFLMQQMQWREALANAKIDNNQDKIQQIKQEVQQNYQQLLVQLQQQFEQQDYANASHNVRQGRFLNKLLRVIQAD